MKKLFAILALVLGMVSCQTEPEGLDVVVGGEQDVNITVSLPEGTRADSALGAFDNVDLINEYDVRFQCEVHYGGQVKVLPVQISDNGKSATFPVRLIANRDYKFVVWADLVKQGETTDLHYITSTPDGLANISINDWAPMDETRDAYTCSEVRRFERNTEITLTLKRPFAKLRVITTDMDQLMGVVPAKAEVEYTTPYRETFNAVDGKAGDAQYKKTHNLFDIASYGETGTDKTLFADYLFVGENDIVNFNMNVYDQNNEPIDGPKSFNTSIPVKRNYVTTIKGNILTYADDFTVTIEDGFDNAGNLEDIPYHYVAVTNGADLLKAISEGRKIIALNDIVATVADKNFEEAVATRSNSSAKNAVLNLNGFTITIQNNGTDALVDLEGGVLIVEGNGAIESTTGALVETIYNVGEATIAENAATEPVVNCLSEIRAAFANGGEYTMVCDLAISESLTLATGKELVFNLNGKTLTGTDTITGSFGLITNKGNLLVKNGTMTLKAENNRGWNAYSSVISNNPGGNLVVENVTIEHFGGTDMAYGIDNLTNGKGTSAIATINEGAVVKSTYRAIRQFLNGIEATNELTVNAGAVVEGANKSIWMQDPSANANTGKLVVNEGATLNGDVYLYVCAGSTEWPVEVSIAASAVNGEVLTGNVPAGYEVVEKDGVWTVIAYPKVSTVEELEKAIKAGGEYVLGANIAMTKSIAISNANFTLDGNGKTITMAEDATNTYALFDITGGKVAIKNITFDSIKSGAIVRTVGVEFNAENITAQNGQHTQQQGLFRLLGKSTIKDCTFKNNTCNMVVTLNFDADSNDYPQIIENCVFEGNTCNDTAVAYYVCGTGATINGNKFLNNTVSSSGNAATLYMGFTENHIITNNLFSGNNVTTTHATSKRATGGLMIGYEATISGNAFVGNTITAEGRQLGNDVCASVYYTDIDLSGNYWGGNAPVEGVNYYKEYTNHSVIINDYLTTNPIK